VFISRQLGAITDEKVENSRQDASAMEQHYQG
jgi:hypothetical protein